MRRAVCDSRPFNWFNRPKNSAAARGKTMKRLHEWVGVHVNIALRSTITVSVHGILREIDDNGVLIETPRGHTYIPMYSVLHISPEKPQ
jgi:hypothetical protein